MCTKTVQASNSQLRTHNLLSNQSYCVQRKENTSDLFFNFGLLPNFLHLFFNFGLLPNFLHCITSCWVICCCFTPELTFLASFHFLITNHFPPPDTSEHASCCTINLRGGIAGWVDLCGWYILWWFVCIHQTSSLAQCSVTSLIKPNLAYFSFWLIYT